MEFTEKIEWIDTQDKECHCKIEVGQVDYVCPMALAVDLGKAWNLAVLMAGTDAEITTSVDHSCEYSGDDCWSSVVGSISLSYTRAATEEEVVGARNKELEEKRIRASEAIVRAEANLAHCKKQYKDIFNES